MGPNDSPENILSTRIQGMHRLGLDGVGWDGQMGPNYSPINKWVSISRPNNAWNGNQNENNSQFSKIRE